MTTLILSLNFTNAVKKTVTSIITNVLTFFTAEDNYVILTESTTENVILVNLFPFSFTATVIMIKTQTIISTFFIY